MRSRKLWETPLKPWSPNPSHNQPNLPFRLPNAPPAPGSQTWFALGGGLQRSNICMLTESCCVGYAHNSVTHTLNGQPTLYLTAIVVSSTSRTAGGLDLRAARNNRLQRMAWRKRKTLAGLRAPRIAKEPQQAQPQKLTQCSRFRGTPLYANRGLSVERFAEGLMRPTARKHSDAARGGSMQLSGVT